MHKCDDLVTKDLVKRISSKAETEGERGARKRVLSKPSLKVAPFTVTRPTGRQYTLRSE